MVWWVADPRRVRPEVPSGPLEPLRLGQARPHWTRKTARKKPWQRFSPNSVFQDLDFSLPCDHKVACISTFTVPFSLDVVLALEPSLLQDRHLVFRVMILRTGITDPQHVLPEADSDSHWPKIRALLGH